MGQLFIAIEESVENLLIKYVDELNKNQISDELKWTVQSAAIAILARYLIKKYPII